MSKPRLKRKPVSLALQGGGAHGTFTWGVLDKILEDGRLEIEAISGTSAGAMNAVALADGWVKDKADGAREALENFWREVSRAAHGSPLKRNPMDVFLGNWSLDNSAGFIFFDLLSRLVSPYDVNPLNINPVRDLLARTIDFDRVQECQEIRIIVSATNVHTGRVRVFECAELTPDAVMASACIPFIFQAVEIDGVPYWDGGYMGNPALFPFFDPSQTNDIIIVQINPIERLETPTSARDILNRVNEITFNASLMRELRAINFVSRLLDEGQLDPSRYKHVLVHRIHPDGEMNDLQASSKLNTEWTFFLHLRDLGREAAEAWLDKNFEHIGKRSTENIRALFE